MDVLILLGLIFLVWLFWPLIRKVVNVDELL